ncbi:MAG: helix-hairpin-helix domain-containing protein [Gemmataceae bacterium]|nr:helix-hairpin-helix domain-containing protein [Gemmataceae bacterium]
MAPGAANSGEMRQPAVQPSAVLAWPAAVQFALGLLVTASVFFLLGRWSQGESAPLSAREAGIHPLDLNLATRAELHLLPGLGDALAQRVVDHRQRIGAFKSVKELRQVSGIGPKTLDRLRPHLFVSPPESFVTDDDSETMSTAGNQTASTRTSSTSSKASKLTEPIDVNLANQAELQKLPGIGPKLSQRILDERAKAPFKSIDDLRRVPGIGPKTLEKLRPYVGIG